MSRFDIEWCVPRAAGVVVAVLAGADGAREGVSSSRQSDGRVVRRLGDMRYLNPLLKIFADGAALLIVRV